MSKAFALFLAAFSFFFGLQRYFVLVKLKSSATQNIRLELRIYTKTTASAWGMLPMQVLCFCLKAT